MPIGDTVWLCPQACRGRERHEQTPWRGAEQSSLLEGSRRAGVGGVRGSAQWGGSLSPWRNQSSGASGRGRSLRAGGAAEQAPLRQAALQSDRPGEGGAGQGETSPRRVPADSVSSRVPWVNQASQECRVLTDPR